MADEALNNMSALFDAMYAKVGRPSIPPEKLLRAQLVQMLYSIRSERLLMEEIDYSMLFRWFVGMNLDEPVWDATVFTKNRDRLLEGDVAREFLCEVVKQAQTKGLTSDEHFTVDGTLIEAWASLKSLKRKDQTNQPPDDPGNPTVNFHGEKRSNQTHESTTNADAHTCRSRRGTGQTRDLLATEHMQLNDEKTRITDFDSGFRFLGAFFLRDSIWVPWQQGRHRGRLLLMARPLPYGLRTRYEVAPPETAISRALSRSGVEPGQFRSSKSVPGGHGVAYLYQTPTRIYPA